jgi:A/G-specific adenine glycosylase
MSDSIASVRRTVWKHYRHRGRHDLPWRGTTDPYAILVSEVMLQQTQVSRVVPKYKAFLTAFPTVTALAAAPLFTVLRMWQGLGYNRRAKLLQATAQVVVLKYAGQFPRDEATLRSLPGIGPYTASALLAFAYNVPVVLIETNVRAVFLHHCVPTAEKVPDSALLPLIAQALPRDRAREWYWALMDYGSYLKTQHGNASRRSRTYAKQSQFVGSNRQVRGAIVRALSKYSDGLTAAALKRAIAGDGVVVRGIRSQLNTLQAEGIVTKMKHRYYLPH